MAMRINGRLKKVIYEYISREFQLQVQPETLLPKCAKRNHSRKFSVLSNAKSIFIREKTSKNLIHYKLNALNEKPIPLKQLISALITNK